MAEQKQISQLLEETSITETMNIPTEDTSLDTPLTRRISLSSLKTFLLDGISSAWSGITGKPFNSIDTNTLNVDESNVLSVKADMYASKDNFDNHINDSEIHITELERTSWNEKLGIDDIVEGVGISLDKDIDSNKITISSLATINPNKILGEYDTVLELETAYPDGSNLDGGFLIGTENPKEYYYWSTTEIPNSWQSAGTLQGEKGTDGSSGLDGKSAYEIAVEKGFVGTEIEWLASLKGADGENGADGKDGINGADGENGIDGLTVSVNNVEQVDGNITLTASDIPVDNENFISTDINGALDELFTSVSSGKSLIASAITDKGVTTLATDTFSTMADNIGQIEGGGGEQLGIYPIGTDGRPTGDVIVPSGVTSLYQYIFYGNEAVQSIIFPNSLTSISVSAFENCKNLKSISFSNALTDISNRAFVGCSKLESIAIPLSVVSIGIQSFLNCSSLTSVILPETLTIINNQAFSGCSSLSDLTLPSSLTSIGNSVFNNCNSLTSITLPQAITSIALQAFQNCINLSTIDCKTITCTFATNVFQNSANLTNFITYPNFNPSNIGFATNINLSVASMVDMSNNLVDLTDQTSKTITFGATNLAKLTTEQKQVFIDKNWVLA